MTTNLTRFVFSSFFAGFLQYICEDLSALLIFHHRLHIVAESRRCGNLGLPQVIALMRLDSAEHRNRYLPSFSLRNLPMLPRWACEVCQKVVLIPKEDCQDVSWPEMRS